MKKINWVKNNQNSEWFDLLRLDINAPYFLNRRGVYVIWYSSPAAAKVIKVGSGNIAERLKNHRANPEITKFSTYGQLKVSWVIVDNINLFENEIHGVERFLADRYSPLTGDNFPNELPVEINLIGN